MNKLIGTILFAIILLSFTYSDETVYPQDFFQSPMHKTLRLSGTFGELRPNHLHAGIDIKANVGEKIYCAGDGFVSRIKIQTGGYGNVLYVSHPNGYTTVYAHMDKFTDELEAYVKRKQYQKESFTIELFPEAHQFAFDKGQYLGRVGMSGRTYGPHLHFEIRDSGTEKPINPLLFGIKIDDNLPPKLHQIKLYAMNQQEEEIGSKLFNLKKDHGQYHVKGDTISFGAWRMGIGLKVYDHMNKVTNWNGIYSLEMYVDGERYYDFAMEKFSFSETRYANAHLDHKERIEHKAYFNRCFVLPGNHLSIYGDKGKPIELEQHRARKIKIIVRDIYHNTSELVFWVKRNSKLIEDKRTFNYFLPYNEKNRIETSSLKLFFPKKSLYENLYLEYQAFPDQSNGIYSSVHHIHKESTPLHRAIKISILPKQIPASLKRYAFIARCEKDNKIVNCGGKWDVDFLETKIAQFGEYCIMVDTVKPYILPDNFHYNMRGQKMMSFQIKDDIDTGRYAKGLKYRATVDGKWILMKYDPKKNKLTYVFDENVSKGKHQIQLQVIDALGNVADFGDEFVY